MSTQKHLASKEKFEHALRVSRIIRTVLQKRGLLANKEQTPEKPMPRTAAEAHEWRMMDVKNRGWKFQQDCTDEEFRSFIRDIHDSKLSSPDNQVVFSVKNKGSSRGRGGRTCIIPCNITAEEIRNWYGTLA